MDTNDDYTVNSNNFDYTSIKRTVTITPTTFNNVAWGTQQTAAGTIDDDEQDGTNDPSRLGSDGMTYTTSGNDEYTTTTISAGDGAQGTWIRKTQLRDEVGAPSTQLEFNRTLLAIIGRRPLHLRRRNGLGHREQHEEHTRLYQSHFTSEGFI